MARTRKYMALVSREGRVFVAHCPEFDVSSQGPTFAKAQANLAEAVEAFLLTASVSEVRRRQRAKPRVASVTVEVGNGGELPQELRAELRLATQEVRRGRVRPASEVLRTLHRRRRS